MNDEPSTNKFDRNELHTPTVRKPSNRKPSRRLVFRLTMNTLSDCEPSAIHLLFRQVLFWRWDESPRPCIFPSILPNFV